jgi:hypothetical protein
MLGTRGVDLDDPSEQVTAAEWLAADHAGRLAEAEHRTITEADRLYDDHGREVHNDTADIATETAIPDVRDRPPRTPGNTPTPTADGSSTSAMTPARSGPR